MLLWPNGSKSLQPVCDCDMFDYTYECRAWASWYLLREALILYAFCFKVFLGTSKSKSARNLQDLSQAVGKQFTQSWPLLPSSRPWWRESSSWRVNDEAESLFPESLVAVAFWRTNKHAHTPAQPTMVFVWKQLTRTLHPIRRLHLHPCVCCSPRRGSNGHTELQLFMTDGERERETESDVLTSHCYWLRATNHCPMADTQKHPKHWKSEKIICWWETQDV